MNLAPGLEVSNFEGFGIGDRVCCGVSADLKMLQKIAMFRSCLQFLDFKCTVEVVSLRQSLQGIFEWSGIPASLRMTSRASSSPL